MNAVFTYAIYFSKRENAFYTKKLCRRRFFLSNGAKLIIPTLGMYHSHLLKPLSKAL